MGFGSKDHKIYVLNRLDEAIYVIPTPNSSYQIADAAISTVTAVAFTVATWGAGSGAAVGAAAKVALTAARIAQVVTVISSLRRLAAIGTSFMDAADRKQAESDIEEIKHHVRKLGMRIGAGECGRVNDETLLNPLNYLGASAWAALAGCSDYSLLIIDESMKRAVRFDTNSDHSWIVEPKRVVRARYGTTTEPSPADGSFFFPNVPTVRVGAPMRAEDCMASPSGRYQLILQTDGNLVLHDGTKPTWSTRTHGTTPGTLAVQDDGNLVLTSGEGKLLRAIDNYGSGPDYEDRVLALQDDGNLVLSTKAGKPVWSTMGNGELLQRPK